MKIAITENSSNLIKGLLNRYMISITSGIYVSESLNSRIFDQIKVYIRAHVSQETRIIFIEKDNTKEAGLNIEYFNYRDIRLDLFTGLPIDLKVPINSESIF